LSLGSGGGEDSVFDEVEDSLGLGFALQGRFLGRLLGNGGLLSLPSGLAFGEGSCHCLFSGRALGRIGSFCLGFAL
jgi:hypothetical protein